MCEHPHESQCLHQHREEQGQVLGSAYRKFVCGVKMDDLWDGVERRAVLSQHVLAIFTLGELHVHEALAAPVGTKREQEWDVEYKGEKNRHAAEKNEDMT